MDVMRTRPFQMNRAMLRGVIDEAGAGVRLISVGGIGSTVDVVDRIRAGAHHVQIATAAMLDPRIGLQIREELRTLFRRQPHRGTAKAAPYTRRS